MSLNIRIKKGFLTKKEKGFSNKTKKRRNWGETAPLVHSKGIKEKINLLRLLQSCSVLPQYVQQFYHCFPTLCKILP